MAVSLLNNKINVGIAKDDFAVWLINKTTESITVRCGELFGFGTGTAAEVPTGAGDIRITASTSS